MTSSTTSTSKPPRNPYTVLQVARNADEKTIKQAYFRLVREFPPEQEPERFQEIRAAYEQLRSPERRAQVDLFLLQPPPPPPSRRSPSYDLRVHPEDIIRLALEMGLAQRPVREEFYEPPLPK